MNIQQIFQTNPSIHNINTRNKQHNLSCFQESTFYTDKNIFNNLPPSVTIIKNEKAKFKAAVTKYVSYIHTAFIL